jgi:hypothetical protein
MIIIIIIILYDDNNNIPILSLPARSTRCNLIINPNSLIKLAPSIEIVKIQ